MGVLDATNQLKPSGKTADAVHELFEKVCERERGGERAIDDVPTLKLCYQ